MGCTLWRCPLWGVRYRGVHYGVYAIQRCPLWGVRYREVSTMGCTLYRGVHYGVYDIERCPLWVYAIETMGCTL